MVDSQGIGERLDGALFHAMVDSAVDGIISIDHLGTVTMMNRSAEKLFGFAAEEVLGRNVSMLMPEPYREEHDHYLSRYMAGGDPRIIGSGREVHGRRKDGSTFPMYLSVSEVEHEQGRLFTAICRDLTERDRASEEMRRMRSYLKNIIDSMPSVLVAVDAEGRVTEWNEEATRWTGLSPVEALGRPFTQLLPQLALNVDRVFEAIRHRRLVHLERLVSEDGDEVRYADAVAYPLIANGTGGAVIRVDDVTNRVRIEQLMVQTEKMMSVGGLAAGMAHEINNPLSVILQGCQNIRRRVSEQLLPNQEAAEAAGVDLAALERYLHARGVHEFLDGIQEAAGRATRIVSDMLSFSRRSHAERELVDVHDMLETVLRLAASDYDLKKSYDFRRVEITREFCQEACRVECDRTGIEQVFLNILRNAAQAMAGAADPPYRIVLRTRRDGQHVRVEIEDNGPGMESRVRQRAFEPFFTTKPVGVGTGLGLSVSYFIITEQHGGQISIRSAPGEGCCFVVELPLPLGSGP